MDVLLQSGLASTTRAASASGFAVGSPFCNGYHGNVLREVDVRSRSSDLVNSMHSSSAMAATTRVDADVAMEVRSGDMKEVWGRRKTRDQERRFRRGVIVVQEGLMRKVGSVIKGGRGSMMRMRAIHHPLGNGGWLPSKRGGYCVFAGLGGVDDWMNGGWESNKGEDKKGSESGPTNRTDDTKECNEEEEEEEEEVGRSTGFVLLPWKTDHSLFTNCKSIIRKEEDGAKEVLRMTKGFESVRDQTGQIKVNNRDLAGIPGAQIVGWTTGSGMAGPVAPTMQQQGETDEACVMKKDDAVGLVMQAALGTGWTTGSGMTGPHTSTQDGAASSLSGHSDDWTPWVGLSTSPRRRMRVKFTCNLCGERTTRAINPHAYKEGTVFAQCQRCGIFHKLADNLNLFNDLKGPDFGKYEPIVKTKRSLFQKDSPYAAFNTWLRVDDSPSS